MAGNTNRANNTTFAVLLTAVSLSKFGLVDLTTNLGLCEPKRLAKESERDILLIKISRSD